MSFDEKYIFRNMHGITQQYLYQLLGFPEKSTDVCLARYETRAKSTKAGLTASQSLIDMPIESLTKHNEEIK